MTTGLPDKGVRICSIPRSRESPLWNALLGGQFRDPGFDPFYRIIETGLIYLGSLNTIPSSEWYGVLGVRMILVLFFIHFLKIDLVFNPFHNNVISLKRKTNTFNAEKISLE